MLFGSCLYRATSIMRERRDRDASVCGENSPKPCEPTFRSYRLSAPDLEFGLFGDIIRINPPAPDLEFGENTTYSVKIT